MKFTLFLLAGATLACSTVFADSIPADLKAKVEAKAKEIKPNDAAAQESWINLQCSAWENLQYITVSISKEEFEAIKKTAAEKFPFEYSEQEKFIMKQSQAADSIEGYKPAEMKPEVFKAIKDAAVKAANKDYEAAEDAVAKQVEAFQMVANFTKPASVDDITFEVTKGVLAKKFAGDYLAQYKALKEIGAPKAEAKAAASSTAATVAKADPKAPKPKNKLYYMKNSVEEFNNMGFVVDDENNPYIAMLFSYQGKPVIILPRSAYSGSPVTLKSVSGETVILKDFFASNEIPVMMSPIDAVPPNMKPATLLESDKYREMISKNLAFITARNGAPFSYTLKIASLDDTNMPTTTKIPPIYPEGSILTDEVGTKVMGVSAMEETRPQLENWSNSENMKSFMRQLERSNKMQKCVRLDALKTWTRMNPEKYLAELKKIQSVAETNMDALVILTASRYESIEERPATNKILAKYKEKFRQRTQKDRFEKFCRDYLLDVSNMLKQSINKINTRSYYGLTRQDMEYNVELSKALIAKIDEILRTRDTLNWIPSQAKSMQERY